MSTSLSYKIEVIAKDGEVIYSQTVHEETEIGHVLEVDANQEYMYTNGVCEIPQANGQVYRVTRVEPVKPAVPGLDNYYATQLARIGNPHTDYAPLFKMTHHTATVDTHTNWLTLNNESASVLVNWLNDHYTITKA